MRAVHFQVDWFTVARYAPTACGTQGFSTIDTDAVTCPLCRSIGTYQHAAQRHREVVEALAYPKEDHPCLNTHRP